MSALYASIGPPPRKTPPRIVQAWTQWDAQHGFDYRAQHGLTSNGDRGRIREGEQPDLDRPCPDPPGWERFDTYPRPAS